MIATVAYQIGTYSGSIDVACDPDHDEDQIIATAKRALKRKCGGMGIYPSGCCYESWRIESRADEVSP